MKLEQKYFNIAAVIALVIAVFLVSKSILFNVPADQPVARSGGFATNCYAASGSTWTADDGCTWLVKSGGTFQMNSGSTLSLASDAVSTGDGQYRNITATATISSVGAAKFGAQVTGVGFSGVNLTSTGSSLLNSLVATKGVSAVNITSTGASQMDSLNVTGAVVAGSFSPAFNTAATIIGTTAIKGDALVATTTFSSLGTSTFTGVATFSALSILNSEIITPTPDVPITPTASIVILQGTATGMSMAPCTTGQQIVVYDAVNAAMVITDTGNAVLAGDQTLGQFDALPLTCISLKWVQTGPVSAN